MRMFSSCTLEGTLKTIIGRHARYKLPDSFRRPARHQKNAPHLPSINSRPHPPAGEQLISNNRMTQGMGVYQNSLAARSIPSLTDPESTPSVRGSASARQ